MKYILIKSKKFGDTKINLTEVIQGKTVLTEALSKEDCREIEHIIHHETNKDIKKHIETAVLIAIDSNKVEKQIETIVANCIAQFYKAIYQKRSFWESSIKNRK